jgi:hypothetical protein
MGEGRSADAGTWSEVTDSQGYVHSAKYSGFRVVTNAVQGQGPAPERLRAVNRYLEGTLCPRSTPTPQTQPGRWRERRCREESYSASRPARAASNSGGREIAKPRITDCFRFLSLTLAGARHESERLVQMPANRENPGVRLCRRELPAVASTGSPTGSPRSLRKAGNSPHPENGQRLAGYADQPDMILPTHPRHRVMTGLTGRLLTPAASSETRNCVTRLCRRRPLRPGAPKEANSGGPPNRRISSGPER